MKKQQTQHWFVPKKYGYGFLPVSWEGWLMTFGLVCVVMVSAFAHNLFSLLGPTVQQLAAFLVDVVMIGVLFSYFAEKKTK